MTEGDYSKLEVVHEKNQLIRGNTEYKTEDYTPNHEIVNAELIWTKKNPEDLERPIQDPADLCLYNTETNG